MEIKEGTLFDTAFENACLALEAPDANGGFGAFDSDGVECQFHLSMVIRVHDGAAPMVSECVYCHLGVSRTDAADAWHTGRTKWDYDCQYNHGEGHRPLPAYWITVPNLLRQAWALTPLNDRDAWMCFAYGATPDDWALDKDGLWADTRKGVPDTDKGERMTDADIRYYLVEQIANMGVNIDPDTPVHNLDQRFNGTER